MINTDDITEGSIVKVYFDNKNEALCQFSNGVFINVEGNNHKDETYGSSVVKYKIIKKCINE